MGKDSRNGSQRQEAIYLDKGQRTVQLGRMTGEGELGMVIKTTVKSRYTFFPSDCAENWFCDVEPFVASSGGRAIVPRDLGCLVSYPYNLL